MNLDYKLLTKTFAERIKHVLPSIISSNQTGYVKERSIQDSIRLVQDLIHYLDINNLPGLLLTIDFQKAFDSINWTFLIKSLEHFDFGKEFIAWIKLFYTDISSCVINNGTTSPYFNIYRGVRQGDPLSPYLFIIATELLSLTISQNKSISGIKVGDKEHKMTQYADDLTLILTDKKSLENAFSVLHKFGNCLGLLINRS